MRFLLVASRFSLRTLRRYRVRTILMMAGIVAGICTLTVVNALSEGARQETVRRFRSMLGSVDTVVIRPGASRTRGMVSLSNVPPTLKFEDANALASGVSEVREVAQVQNAFDIDVKYIDRLTSPAIFGVSANWSPLRGDEAAQGSLLTQADVEALSRVAVLGGDVAAALFGDSNPLGQSIRIEDVPFSVKGVLRRRGAAPGGGSLDDIVVIPITTAGRRLFNRDYLTMVVARLRDPSHPEVAVGEIRKLLRERHHLADSALDDFTLTSPRAMMGRFTSMRTSLSMILTGVAVLMTALGAVMILTLMFQSVGERRREIGICRAVGAARNDVLIIFLLEALLCAGLAGVIGVVLGTGFVSVLVRTRGVVAALIPATLAVEIGLALGIGLMCGLLPAWQAARTDPVIALRT